MNRIAFVAALALTGAAAALASPGSAAADTYFGCRAGYELQVSGNYVRCEKPGETRWGRHHRCLPGQRLRRDYTGNRDMCVTGIGVAAVAAPPACPRGWSLISRPGGDRCRKVFPGSVEAPTRQVNL